MNSLYRIIILFVISATLFSCKTSRAVKNNHKTSLYKNEVFACYYHDKYNGRKTASGTRFSNRKLTAAHKTLSFGTRVRVTNPVNKKSVIVVINDRGPFTKGLEIDLSKRAFMQITDDKNKGKLKVTLEIAD